MNFIKKLLALFKKDELLYQFPLEEYTPPKKRPRLYKQATVVTKGEIAEEKKVPLKKGTSDKTRSANIAKEIKAGKKPSQAAAIGYAVQREAIAKKGGEKKGKK
jgi:hypothetical protein